jgi:hypothetical protein
MTSAADSETMTKPAAELETATNGSEAVENSKDDKNDDEEEVEENGGEAFCSQ